MKLINILARELKVFPYVTDVVGQACDGSLHLNASYKPNRGFTEEEYTLAEDWMSADVTRAQWQAARDALSYCALGCWLSQAGGAMSEFVEVNTADLVGAALDWAVGLCMGWEYRRCRDLTCMGWYDGKQENFQCTSWRPSTEWTQGGPLIEKYRIDFAQYADQVEAFSQIRSPGSKGGTYLVAACRAIVASVLGETVSVPKELLS